MLLVNSINFNYASAHRDGILVEKTIDTVEVDYEIIHGSNVIDSRAVLSYDEYKQLRHEELEVRLREAFKETVKTIE